jgi:hypothetical protein
MRGEATTVEVKVEFEAEKSERERTRDTVLAEEETRER